MQNKKMYSEILTNIKTKKEASGLSDLLETVLEEMGGDISKLGQIVQKHVKEPHSSTIISYMKDKKVEELTKLAVFLKDIEELKLTLSFSPKKNHLDELVSWTKQNIGEDFVMKFDVDETILGGVLLSFKGKYKDYSLRKMLETRN